MDEDRVHILDQNHWQPATPALKGGYMVIDLNKPDLVTYSFNKRFRQGENGVKIPLWFYDGSVPHQLDPAASAVTAYGKDSNGKIKVVEAQSDPDWQSGRVDMYLPLAVFQAAGQYQRFLIEVKNNDQIIATINFNLDVLPNDFYNVSIGSDNFSSQIDDEIYNRLKEFSERVKKIAKTADGAVLEFKGDYDLLKAQADNTSKIIEANQIVKLADYNKKMDELSAKRYTAKDLDWKAPFMSWSEAGGTSVAVADGVVHLSISTISSSMGSVVCVLPETCRPKSEKISTGVALDGDGHNSYPVWVSIMDTGEVVVENNPHEIAKIAIVGSYTLDESEEGNGDSGDTGGETPIESIVESIQSVKSGDSIAVNQDTQVYLSDGSVSRTLSKNTVWAVDRKGVMKGYKVVRISNDEWVKISDPGVYYVTSGTGTVTINSSVPGTVSIVDRYGNSVTYSFKNGDSYKYDAIMNKNDGQVIYYRLSPDQWINSISVAMGGTGTVKPTEPDNPKVTVTDIGVTTANDNAGIYKTTTLYRGDGSVSRTINSGNNLNIDRFGFLNGAKVFRVSSDEWVKESDIAHTLDGAQGVLKIKNNPQSVYHISGIPYSTTLGVGEPYVYKRRMYKAGGVTAYELSPDQYIDSTQCTL